MERNYIEQKLYVTVRWRQTSLSPVYPAIVVPMQAKYTHDEVVPTSNNKC